MLQDSYELTIVSTYKIDRNPAFDFGDNITIKYLINENSNKKELTNSIKELNIKNTLYQTIKGIKLVSLKYLGNIKEIRKTDSDVIITTRIFHNFLVDRFAKKSILRIATEHNSHKSNFRYTQKLIKSCRSLDYLVVVSNSLEEFYKDKLQHARCVHIPNVIDEIPQDRSKLYPNQLVSIGRLVREKGFEDLIDVIKEVKKTIEKVKLSIIGDGYLYQQLKRRIDQNGLSENIILHGFQNSESIKEQLLEKSLYVMSSYSESFGISLIEAMSYAIPCLAFDSAEGAKELISNGNNGYLIKDRDKSEMAKLIIRLLNDRKLLVELSDNALNNVHKYLSSNIRQNWIDLIEKPRSSKVSNKVRDTLRPTS
jgi:N-acetylglucosaminyldiphosphoundecaprenol N-acetyl-beta-D-mannosaminyltransferase